ncbi:hypothetical protein DH2020_042605 [Rehmannia glutinosa]|uniref:Uncharacterized protein n=1 Tax=Rehmannia glutinosa TaxID=99300 RepID=A0ABR0UMF8_REHGL
MYVRAATSFLQERSGYKTTSSIHTSLHPLYSTMKTTHLSLFFILFSIYTNSLLCTAAEQPSPVLDIDGNKVRAGVDYYILPVIRGRGGGLTLATTGNDTCPLSVVQEQMEVKNGLPLTFTPVNAKKALSVSQLIRTSSFLLSQHVYSPRFGNWTMRNRAVNILLLQEELKGTPGVKPSATGSRLRNTKVVITSLFFVQRCAITVRSYAKMLAFWCKMMERGV